MLRGRAAARSGLDPARTPLRPRVGLEHGAEAPGAHGDDEGEDEEVRGGKDCAQQGQKLESGLDAAVKWVVCVCVCVCVCFLCAANNYKYWQSIVALTC